MSYCVKASPTNACKPCQTGSDCGGQQYCQEWDQTCGTQPGPAPGPPGPAPTPCPPDRGNLGQHCCSWGCYQPDHLGNQNVQCNVGQGDRSAGKCYDPTKTQPPAPAPSSGLDPNKPVCLNAGSYAVKWNPDQGTPPHQLSFADIKRVWAEANPNDAELACQAAGLAAGESICSNGKCNVDQPGQTKDPDSGEYPYGIWQTLPSWYDDKGKYGTAIGVTANVKDQIKTDPCTQAYITNRIRKSDCFGINTDSPVGDKAWTSYSGGPILSAQGFCNGGWTGNWPKGNGGQTEEGQDPYYCRNDNFKNYACEVCPDLLGCKSGDCAFTPGCADDNPAECASCFLPGDQKTQTCFPRKGDAGTCGPNARCGSDYGSACNGGGKACPNGTNAECQGSGTCWACPGSGPSCSGTPPGPGPAPAPPAPPPAGDPVKCGINFDDACANRGVNNNQDCVRDADCTKVSGTSCFRCAY